MEDFDATMPPKRVREPENNNENYVPGDFDPNRTIPNRRMRREMGEFSVGDVIAYRYQVVSVLGRGAMGVVYRCFDKVASIEVALKGLPPELAGNDWEMKEIRRNFQLVHNLHHPNIASYNTLEFDQTSGGYFLVMEFVDGVELRTYMENNRPDHATIIKIISQIASALDYAHNQQILHRDIKPGNIMIDRNGVVKILDFGLAAQIRTSMTKVSMEQDSSGTAPYMSPEQWRGKRQSAASDQYALTVVAYEMFAGFLPFESTDPLVLKRAVLDETPEPLTNVSPSIQYAVNKALSKAPEERFANCTAFALALTAPVKRESKSKSGKIILLVVLLAILCGGGIGSWLVLKDSQAPKAQKKEKAAVSSNDKASEKELAQAKEAEEQQKLEAERKAKEEQQKLEAERKAKEEQQKLEAERKAREEAELRLAEERKAREEAERRVREAEQQRLEAERKAKEEQQRLEAERKAKEEQQRLEAERKAKEEQQRLEAERKAKEEREKRIAEQVRQLKAKGVKFSEDNKTLVKCPKDFLGVIVIPSCVTTIGKEAFYSCDKLTTVTIPDSVTTIGEKAFSSCKSLTSVTIPDSVTTIGNWAFSDCSKLTYVTIPDSVTTIGVGAFIGVRSVKVAPGNRYYKIDSHGALLTKDGKKIFYLPPGFSGHYTIPDSVTTIGEAAFFECKNLTVVTIPYGVTTIGETAFYECKNLTSVTIPNSVTTIGRFAFSHCESLTTVTIPYGVTTIGAFAFYECKNLTVVTIHYGVTTIGENAFSSCRNLTSVTIPDSVTTIGNWAFSSCLNLTAVTISRDCKIGVGAFSSWCKVIRR